MSDGFPAGLITQVDRDGHSNYQPPAGDDLAASESCIQLTEDSSREGRKEVKKKWWQSVCKCFSPAIPTEEGGRELQPQSSQLNTAAWLPPDVRQQALPNNPDPSANDSAQDYSVADTSYESAGGQKTGVQSHGGSPGYHFPGALMGSKRVAHKITLILDLDETLVHSSFKPVPGADWVVPVEVDGTVHRVFVCKRPGLDIFMKRVAEQFEVVVFTASLDKYANPVLDLMERNAPNSVHFRLFREHCVLTNGALVKDITRMGREPRKCIIVDNSAASYMLQPENSIPISSWFDAPNDQQLLLMLPWLQRMADQDDVLPLLHDMRQVMEAYHGNLQSPMDMPYN
mmetsp:Transcript_99194/g.145068  ORF Transcript_99194/g.145068 Transcript_99194/m.145068 type:complete len:343 (+) Transcript_99194:293-1321(+)